MINDWPETYFMAVMIRVTLATDGAAIEVRLPDSRVSYDRDLNSAYG